MRIVDKVKEYGFLGSIGKIPTFIHHTIIKWYNNFFFTWYKRLPIDQHSIVLESEGDCCDNAYALFDYMKNNGYLGKYRITWLVEHPENFKAEDNVQYVQKEIWDCFAKETIKELRTCKWYIYDHCDILGSRKRAGQKSFFLTHGAGFKAASSSNAICYADTTYSLSPFFYKRVSDWCGCKVESMKDLGFSRLDFFFEEMSNNQVEFQKKHKLDAYKKVFLWMPTFRTSKNKDLTEDYFLVKQDCQFYIRKKNWMSLMKF